MESNEQCVSKYIVISNDCTSGQYYKLNKCEFNNPFVWNIWWYIDDYVKFIKNFNNINFNNYETLLTNDNEYFSDYKLKFNPLTYYVNVDNKYKIAYPHYISKKDYVDTKYKVRLDRFNKYKNVCETIFMLNEKSWTSIEDELKFINVITPYKKFLYTSHKELLKYKNDNMIIIYKENIDYPNSFKTFANILTKTLDRQ